MRRALVALATALACLTAGSLPPAPAHTAAAKTVFAAYYPWYGGQANGWRHWNASGHTPPQDVASVLYPTLGAYDSGDGTALYYHLAWAQIAKVDVLAVSWWGRGSYEDQQLPALFAAAAQTPVRLAWILEPYAGRTAATFAADVQYLCATYFTHPATFKASRPSQYGPSTTPRPVLFVYDPTISDTAWQAATDALRGTACDATVLVRADDSLLLTDSGVRTMGYWGHFDGAFNFGAYTYGGALPASPDYLVVPTVAPGFDNTRIGGTSVVGRQNGARYDDSWSSAINARAEWVLVNSFNEWHEGTAIEPAQPFSYRLGMRRYTYQSFENAYGQTGQSAQAAYLTRTAYWVDQWRR